MEKIDIIKSLINYNEQLEEEKTDNGNVLLGHLLSSYFEEYIEPKLVDLSKQDLIEKYDNTLTKKVGSTKKLYMMIINIIRELYIDEDNSYLKADSFGKSAIKFFNLTKYKELNILQTKDKQVKKEFADEICNIFIYNYSKRKFFENNIKPILTSLNQSNTISYSKDSDYIDLYIASIIDELYHFKLLKDEDNNFIDFLNLTDDKEIKKIVDKKFIKYFTIYFTNFFGIYLTVLIKKG